MHTNQIAGGYKLAQEICFLGYPALMYYLIISPVSGFFLIINVLYISRCFHLPYQTHVVIRVC